MPSWVYARPALRARDRASGESRSKTSAVTVGAERFGGAVLTTSGNLSSFFSVISAGLVSLVTNRNDSAFWGTPSSKTSKSISFRSLIGRPFLSLTITSSRTSLLRKRTTSSWSCAHTRAVGKAVEIHRKKLRNDFIFTVEYATDLHR